MIQQNELDEVKEQIAIELCLYCREHDDAYGNCSLDDADKPCKASLVTAETILSYIQQPEVFDMLVKGKGYIKLDEDQSLPLEPSFYDDYGGAFEKEGYRHGQDDLVYKDWRKVKLRGKK